jgi:hypothetical protein
LRAFSDSWLASPDVEVLLMEQRLLYELDVLK